ncbi:hypothetical protein ADK78_04350 [Kitasatospora aureofaciens]|nr:hypothetical protein ADK78_04350 [Kitasatospora aureofaciens]KOT44881.1 hypothetical protein ADK84_06020 [Streptomyces sp. NRRL WC-3701]KOT64996.1 hypothetical protein ADK44_08235 [Streptomyces rimosus subsp. rimosus]QEV76576.1 hypothetical protein CP984_17535 [Streptomyces rimosus]KOT87735.1 hypothetical protein ADK48_08790 [Streptomyces rimosus subsp. rimosus]
MSQAIRHRPPVCDHARMVTEGEHARSWTAAGSGPAEPLAARLRRFSFDRHTHGQPATGIARKGRARPAARW